MRSTAPADLDDDDLRFLVDDLDGKEWAAGMRLAAMAEAARREAKALEKGALEGESRSAPSWL